MQLFEAKISFKKLHLISRLRTTFLSRVIRDERKTEEENKN